MRHNRKQREHASILMTQQKSQSFIKPNNYCIITSSITSPKQITNRHKRILRTVIQTRNVKNLVKEKLQSFTEFDNDDRNIKFCEDLICRMYEF